MLLRCGRCDALTDSAGGAAWSAAVHAAIDNKIKMYLMVSCAAWQPSTRTGRGIGPLAPRLVQPVCRKMRRLFKNPAVTLYILHFSAHHIEMQPSFRRKD